MRIYLQRWPRSNLSCFVACVASRIKRQKRHFHNCTQRPVLAFRSLTAQIAPSFQQRALGALEGAGWRAVGTKGDGVYLCRPGKDSGVSASWGVCRSKIGAPLLKVFSSSTAFDTDYANSPFDVVCLIQYGGSKDALLAELSEGEFDDSHDLLPEKNRLLGSVGSRELGAGHTTRREPLKLKSGMLNGYGQARFPLEC